MFKKIMASFGVGAAKVNLVLDNEKCRIGESVRGKMVVQGGNVAQGIHTLDVDVVMKLNSRGKEISRVVETIRVARDFRIEARDTREIPFEHQIPFHYPLSKGSVSYTLVTKMDIAQAVDTGDADPLVVLPSREMELVFDALQFLGFKEKIGSGKIGQYGQEFMYYPSGQFAEQLKEMEFKFFIDSNDCRLYFELEIANGFMRSGQKHHAELTIPATVLASGSVQELAQTIREFLEEELRQVSVQGPRLVPSYQQQQHRPGMGSAFGGFMGGMVAGMLGGALLGELFGDDEAEAAETYGDMGGEEGGFDFGLGDFGDFGGDEW
ncbi:sporulation protein [Desulforamulus ferrireducens]|uniref:SpoOM family protein n=1 Tax=Desulforamulus ferrireducens TaxID=1833852 RepID=A0A1S6IYZ9_9FIRM|nr:sporulation protein [Desulforamulus ferrireducens]AQS60001.1 SpoOM family protein [Desulforamulus ferrireducens]